MAKNIPTRNSVMLWHWRGTTLKVGVIIRKIVFIRTGEVRIYTHAYPAIADAVSTLAPHVKQLTLVSANEYLHMGGNVTSNHDPYQPFVCEGEQDMTTIADENQSVSSL